MNRWLVEWMIGWNHIKIKKNFCTIFLGVVYFPRSSTWCILFNFLVQTQLQVTTGYWRSSCWFCWTHVLPANLATRLVWKTTLETGINIFQIHSFLHSDGDGSFSCHRYWIEIIHKTNHVYNQIKVQNISTVHPFNRWV